MSPEPRHEEEYTDRKVEAARRVLIDLGQVLASFVDCLVVVGGWAPDLLMIDIDEPHIGSMDVDMALDVDKLRDGRYAALVKLLTDTGRYHQGAKPFQFVVAVDLQDGEGPVQVEVDFLAPKDVKLDKHRPRLVDDFRVLQVDGAEVSFRDPVQISLSGKNVKGVKNSVKLRVVSAPDHLVMKANAIAGRDKPKDTYDLCFCLEHFPAGMETIAQEWKRRASEMDIAKAISVLQEKFADVNTFGPQQLVEFHNSPDPETNAMHARRAYELVQKFLTLLK